MVNNEYNPVVTVDGEPIEWRSDLLGNYLSQVGSSYHLKQDLLGLLLALSPNVVSHEQLTSFLQISVDSLESLVYQTRRSMRKRGNPLRGLVEIETIINAVYRLKPVE